MSVCPCCSYAGKFEFSFDQLEWMPWGEELQTTYTVCPSCGMGVKTPFPDKARMREYYQTRWQYPSRPMKATARWLGESLRANVVSEIPRAVEIGAKDMALLDGLNDFIRVRNRGGFDAGPQSEGVEPLWVGDGIPHTHENDLVCACHVLDHAFDLHAFMDDLVGLARPEAYIFIEVHSVEAETSSARGDCFRTHNYQLPISALTKLAESNGLSVCRADWSVQDDATNTRVLLRKGRSQGNRMLLKMKSRRDSMHRKAATVALSGKDPEKVALYGASGSFYEMVSANAGVRKFRLFDTFRHGGNIRGVEIESPDNMGWAEDVLICTSHKQSAEAIRAWLEKHHPTKNVSSLF